MAQPFEPVQERVEHAVGPLHAAPGELADALEDRVPVQVAVREDPSTSGVAEAATRSLSMRTAAPIPRTDT